MIFNSFVLQAVLLMGLLCPHFGHGVDIFLLVSETKTLDAPAGATVVNSSKGVFTLRESQGRLLIRGKKLGEGALTINGRKRVVRVLKQTAQKSLQNILPVLNGMMGLQASIEEGRVVIKGELLRLDDWLAIASLATTHSLEYTFQAHIGPELRSEVQAWIESNSKEALLPPPQLHFVPFPQVLLPTEHRELRTAYDSVLRSMGLKSQVAAQVVGLEPVVEVEILVTELRRKHFRRMGLRYPTSHEAQALPSPNFDQPLRISIEAIEENGWGRVLASPRLICRNGKEASFLAGGEIPIRTSGFQSGSVAWKKYGVQLNAKPKADRSGRMSLALVTEVSSIDSSQTIDGIPGLLMNRIQTHFDLAKSQTVALSGLIRQEQGNSREGLPFLSNIPVLGLLFSSQEFRSLETELVIFVTPKVLDPTLMPQVKAAN